MQNKVLVFIGIYCFITMIIGATLLKYFIEKSLFNDFLVTALFALGGIIIVLIIKFRRRQKSQSKVE